MFMLKKRALFVISAIILFTSVFNVNIVAYSSENYYDKLSEELTEIMETKKQSENISVCIWYDDVNHEEIEEKIIDNIGISKKRFKHTINNAI